MRKKAVCRFGVCLLSIYLLFSNSVLSRAGEEGTEVPAAGSGGKQEEISEPAPDSDVPSDEEDNGEDETPVNKIHQYLSRNGCGVEKFDL